MVVDAPQEFLNSVPQVWATTHPTLAYVWLHGSNAATWDVKGATAASGLTVTTATRSWRSAAGRITTPETLVPQTHVAFTNNREIRGSAMPGQ